MGSGDRHVSMIYELANATLQEFIDSGRRAEHAVSVCYVERRPTVVCTTGFFTSGFGNPWLLAVIIGFHDEPAYEAVVRKYLTAVGLPNRVLSGSDFGLLEKILWPVGMELCDPGFGLSRLFGAKIVVPVKQTLPQTSHR